MRQKRLLNETAQGSPAGFLGEGRDEARWTEDIDSKSNSNYLHGIHLSRLLKKKKQQSLPFPQVERTN